MEISYYDLSGGINFALTKTELGMDTKKIYWADSKNVEILENRGIKKQNGNTLFVELPVEEAITGMHEMFANNQYKLLITTYSGNIFVYEPVGDTITTVNKTLSGKKPSFTNFLGGTIVITEADSPFFINFSDLSWDDCNLLDNQSNPIIANALAVYRGRVWFCSNSTIYYSALGTYNDFSTPDDAGYISDFHTDTALILAMKPYKEYLAIYKTNNVYLLSGTSPDDFAVTPFASKGCISKNAILNVDNKQYFLSNGIFALEQTGVLNQVQLGSEISLKIKPELDSLSPFNLVNTFAIHYEYKHQMWFFFPYNNEEYFHTVWINDYVNKAWYKRVIPQNITCACMFKYNVLTGDDKGKIYMEDYGNTFNGQPIDFMWKSSFLSNGTSHHRKMIDEFYFVLDELYDNNFNFSVYKDYDDTYKDDNELIYSGHLEYLIWADDDTLDNLPCHWVNDDDNVPIWTINKNSIEKAEISGSNYAIQLCVEGNELLNNCGIIGLQFREIYKDE